MEIVKKSIKLPVLSLTGEKIEEVKLDGAVFGIAMNPQVVHDAVCVDMAGRRQATAKTKTRAEVRGGGKKPWRQKGTGRARAGSNRSPIWVHGGIVFGPTGVQNFKLDMNRKAHALALKSVLSDKALNNQIIVMENKQMESYKTKDALKTLAALKAEGKILIVIPEYDENLINSIYNLPNVSLVSVKQVSVYEVLKADVLLFAKDALIQLQEVLA